MNEKPNDKNEAELHKNDVESAKKEFVDPVIDEAPEEIAAQRKAKRGWMIFFGVMIVLMVACVIVIYSLN